MKPVLHIFWKDLRRLRWMLLLWWAVIAVHSFILSSEYDVSMTATMMSVLDNLLPGLEILAFLMLLLLVGVLIHGDSLVGTTAFWLTRPISRWTLLAAKSLFGVAALLLPMVFAEAFVLLSNGITLGDTVVCLADAFCKGRLVLLLVIATLAALTPNLPRLVVAGVLLVTMSLVLWYAGMIVSARFGLWPPPMSLRTSAVFAQSFVAVVLCSATVLHQFGTRRTIRSATFLSSGIAFFTMVSLFWPVDFFSQPGRPVDEATFDPSRVEVSLADSPLLTPFGYRTAPGQPGYVSGALEFSNVEQGFIVRPVAIRSSLTLEDGTTLTQHPSDYVSQLSYAQLSETERDGLQEQIEKLVGNVALLNPEDVSGYSYLPKLIRLDKSQYEKYRNRPGVLSAKVTCEVVELRVEAEIPVQVGARRDRGSYHFAIIDISPQLGGIAVTVRLWYPGSTFIDRELDWDHLVLLNRNKSGAVVGKYLRGGWRLPKAPIPFNASPFTINHWMYVFAAPAESHQRIDDAWIQAAKLVLIDEVELGTFEKRFDVDNFLMKK